MAKVKVAVGQMRVDQAADHLDQHTLYIVHEERSPGQWILRFERRLSSFAFDTDDVYDDRLTCKLETALLNITWKDPV